MLGVIRQNTYHANLRPLQSEFYDFCESGDEMAAPLIAKSLRKLLRKAPFVLLRQTEISDQQCLPRSFPSSGSAKWPVQMTSGGSDGVLFHSDSSLSSNCSTASSDSCASSSSISPFSSSSSLSEVNKKKKKRERSVEVILPHDMMTRLVRDIIRVAEGEQNGIRGCQLQVEVTDSESDLTARVGKINCDPKLLPDCVLRVHLVSIPPPPEAHGSQVLLNRLLGAPTYNVYIKPGYTIEKRKLDSNKKEIIG